MERLGRRAVRPYGADGLPPLTGDGSPGASLDRRVGRWVRNPVWADATDFTDEENWLGGYYELASGLVTAAHLAVTDWRDAKIAADKLRNPS